MEQRASESNQIPNRIRALRDAMKARGITHYLIPTSDAHQSEYVCAYCKVREYYSGFTGSNGTLLVTTSEAFLWTDGRYFVQAEKELTGTSIQLMKMGEPGVPTIREYVKSNLKDGDVLGFDGKVVDATFGTALEKELSGKQVRLTFAEDVAGDLWQNRPAYPSGEVRVIPESYFGENVGLRLLRLREKLEERGADALFLSKLDDLMWLFQIRGCDVPCNPVAMCYALITREHATVFIAEDALSDAVRAHFDKFFVQIRPYAEVFDALKAYCSLEPPAKHLLYDPHTTSYLFYKEIARRAGSIALKSPTEEMKAVKTDTELSYIHDIYLKDSVILTKFIYRMKMRAKKAVEEGADTIGLNEFEAAKMLDDMRLSDEDCFDLSFDTIAAYGPNAAMMHYEATKEENAVIKPEGFLLVDSGGQYMGGTTDVTRTIVMGPLSEKMKKHFTLSLAGMLRLSHATFMDGCTGRNLDILARQPLWEIGSDYKCGTGHGIGYMLNVHEGPQNIRYRYNKDMEEALLKPGMLVSDEPGVYLAGEYGIRIENILEVVNKQDTPDGTFYGFSHLTYVPIDPEAVDPKLLTAEDIALLNAYQQTVFEKISPHLNEDEKKWLKQCVKPLK